MIKCNWAGVPEISRFRYSIFSGLVNRLRSFHLFCVNAWLSLYASILVFFSIFKLTVFSMVNENFFVTCREKRWRKLEIAAASFSSPLSLLSLKSHCDEVFRIHCFCIFWIFKWYLLTCPSRFVQQAREDGFFYGFSRTFFVRHY